jgi:hypothetical protein
MGSFFDESGEQSATSMERTADGKPLLLRRPGLSPLEYGDRMLYSRTEEVEIVLWLLSAAGSGIAGNLAYDAVKQLVEKARKGHEKFLGWFNERRRDYEKGDLSRSPLGRGWPPEPGQISPRDHLRDDLVELAYDVLARYRNMKNEGAPLRSMSEIRVFLTERMTWGVRTRELRAHRGNYVEIDLREQMEKSRYQAVGNIEEFPVRIWY